MILAMMAVGLSGSGLGVTYADDSLREKEATPTIKKHLTTDTIKGTLMNE